MEISYWLIINLRNPTPERLTDPDAIFIGWDIEGSKFSIAAWYSTRFEKRSGRRIPHRLRSTERERERVDERGKRRPNGLRRVFFVDLALPSTWDPTLHLQVGDCPLFAQVGCFP